MHGPHHPLLQFERQFASRPTRPLAGVDEAGRGPLAGPVVAAAVILPEAWCQDGLPQELHGLTDSKQLSPKQRERFCLFLVGSPSVSHAVATVGSETIDHINILQATHLAMRLALEQLDPPPAHALVDGRPVPNLPCSHTALVKGDALSASIAAASVIAKVTRDRLMLELDRLFPGYGFASHKGYGTAEHLDALRRLGPSPVHRRSFAPIRPTQPGLFSP